MEFANPGQRLKAGMFAQVTIAGESKEALMVPVDAIIRTGKRALAFVSEQPGQYTPVEVEVGQEMDGKLTVLSGLKDGQQVAVSGQFLIDSEASLSGLTQRMGAGSTGAGDTKTQAAAGPIHEGTGTVEALSDTAVTLKHGPIASLQWGSMTMPFSLAEPRRGEGPEGGRQRALPLPAGRWRLRHREYREDRRWPMIEKLIRWSVRNRFLVLLATAFFTAWGVWAVRTTPIDALPDLSDVQVIIRTTYPGQAPQIVENQVTYPARYHDAVGAGRQDRARLLVLRRFLRVRAVRGRHRPVLGALARARVPEPGAGAAAADAPGPRWGRTPPVSAGSTSTRWWTAPGATTCRSCGRCRTGSCASS